METTAMILMGGFIFSYLVIEKILVTPPIFLPVYIAVSTLLVMLTV